MSTGIKILVFIVAVIVITIIKDVAPTLVIPATMIGGFIAMSLFFSKKESSPKEPSNTNIQQKDNSESKNIDVIIQSNDYASRKKIIEEIALKDNPLASISMSEEKGNSDVQNNDKKLITWSIWKFERTLTYSQKVIYSLSIFSIFLVICFALAESVDYHMRMKETWFIWVGFIISQAWFQNKFWNNGTKFEIVLKRPDLSEIKNNWTKNKRQFFIPFAVIVFILYIILVVIIITR
jgi:hypothetical protein